MNNETRVCRLALHPAQRALLPLRLSRRPGILALWQAAGPEGHGGGRRGEERRRKGGWRMGEGEGARERRERKDEPRF